MSRRFTAAERLAYDEQVKARFPIGCLVQKTTGSHLYGKVGKVIGYFRGDLATWATNVIDCLSLELEAGKKVAWYVSECGRVPTNL